MTTIDDEVLARLRHQANVTSEATIGSIAGVWARQSDLRTLLASYDEMKGRIEEAVRLMEPAIIAGTIRSPFGTRKALTGWAVDLASFVSREKVDGGARG